MNRIRTGSLLAAAVAIVAIGTLVGTGAARTDDPDQFVTVQVRHDRLGLLADAGIVIDDAELAGRASITGKLLSISDEFVILEMEHNHEVWIPRDNVLLLRIRR